MTNDKLQDLWEEIKALNDEDLATLAVQVQAEQQARQRPQVQVHFKAISGELIESRKWKASASAMNLKLAMLPVLELRGGNTPMSLQSFDFVCQERILKPSDTLASLGDGDQTIQVVMRRDPIRLTQKLRWPNIWRAKRSCDPPLSPEFFVIKSSQNAVIKAEKVFQTEDSPQLWREVKPGGTVWQALITSELSGQVTRNSTVLVKSSALDVSLFADMVDEGRIYYLMTEDDRTLQPWPNARPWSDGSSEELPKLDLLVLSATTTEEILPLVERFRQFFHELSKVMLAATARGVEYPQAFFHDCVKELRSAGLKPLEMLTLEPHFTGSAVIVAARAGLKRRAE
eukprot:s749_g4.t1